MDGVGFGPTFPHFLILACQPAKGIDEGEVEEGRSEWMIYEPRIFGFRIHKSSPMAGQMKWLRTKPNTFH